MEKLTHCLLVATVLAFVVIVALASLLAPVHRGPSLPPLTPASRP